jgi:hypothetical protein
MKKNPENPATGCAEFTEKTTGLKFSLRPVFPVFLPVFLPVFPALAVAAFSL